MTTTAGNSLHVLRLIWRQPIIRRPLATAARLKELDEPERPSFFSPDRSAFAEAQQSVPKSDFLEPESSEYETISVALPRRSFKAVNLPWPTVFPPAQAQRSSSPRHRIKSIVGLREPKHNPDHPLARPKPCDPLARLVLAGDFAGARRVFDELRASKIPIQDRLIYLPAAISCLEAKDPEGFLFWLCLYPNRPATKTHNDLRDTWYPVVLQLIRQHTLDTELLADFIHQAAGRGLLPIVFLPLMRHLIHILPPQESIRVSREVFERYKRATIPAGSITERGRFVESIVIGQVDAWWNACVRGLVMAGWSEAAATVCEGSDAEWSEFTRKMVSEALDDRHVSTLPAYEVLTPESPEDCFEHVHGPLGLAKQLRHALHSEIRADQLAPILRALEQVKYSHPTLLDRFNRRFCQSSIGVPSQHALVPKQKVWWHAMMISLLDRGERPNHRESGGGNAQAVIHIFMTKFVWIGLPGRPPRVPSSPNNSIMFPLLPSIYIINTLLPCILDGLPDPVESFLAAYHAAYLAQAIHLPPVLRPNSDTHELFIRSLILHLDTAEAGLSGLQAIVEAGFDPGERCYSRVLAKLVKENNFAVFDDLIARMEARALIGNGGLTLPIPDQKTYEILGRQMEGKRRLEDAEKLYKKARRQESAELDETPD